MTAAARHLCLAKQAKRARPRLVHMFGVAIDAPADPLADVAVAAEFIHSASLMHDDVIDHGTMRRNQQTVNTRWDNLTAVLSGDVLLSEAIYGLRRWHRCVTEEALQLVANMSRAAMMEAHVRTKTDVSIDQWRYIAEGKTGEMFQWCGRATGWVANNESATKHFGEFGRRFGVAFQMADDLKDLLGGNIGKDRFADIRNANPSYPIIIATQRSPALNAELTALWNQTNPNREDIARIGQAILDTGAAEATHQQLGREINEALDSLGEFRDRTGCAEIAAWVTAMWESFNLEVAV